MPVDGPETQARRRVGVAPPPAWLVTLPLPVEADTPGEAVRLFWRYVSDLGPAELPVYVSPAGNELAMRPYVLGEPTNLDPEEDEE